MSASSNLVLHCGARLVNEEELRAIKAPPPEGRWFPTAHIAVVDRVRETLTAAGYAIQKQQFGLSRNDARFFGTFDLATPLVSGTALAVGIRNSVDKSFPLGFVAGNRVFCCDNLAFRSDLLAVRRKHTRHGEARFAEAIAGAVSQLGTFKEQEAERLRRFMSTELTEEQACTLILHAYERGIVSAPLLPKVIAEWREPQEAFRPRCVFSLMNAFTSALRDRARTNPNVYCGQTMRLNALLDIRDAEPEVATAV